MPLLERIPRLRDELGLDFGRVCLRLFWLLDPLSCIVYGGRVFIVVVCNYRGSDCVGVWNRRMADNRFVNLNGSRSRTVELFTVGVDRKCKHIALVHFLLISY